MACHHRKLVGSRDQGQAAQPRQFSRCLVGESFRGVQACSNGGAAEREWVQLLQRCFNALSGTAELIAPG